MFNGLTTKLALGLMLFAVLANSACGFRPRGSVELPEPLAMTYITGTPEDSELALAIEQALLNRGAGRVMSLGEATAVLQIHAERYNRRVLSVDAQGKASEYELTYRLNYSLRDAADALLVAQQQVVQQRDYVYDASNVLGKSDEESLLRKEMLEAAVRQMLYRLRVSMLSGVSTGQGKPVYRAP